jgi:hypothetical protein
LGAARLWPDRADKDFHVLTGGDKPILDLLTPESAPAGTLEAVVIGRLSKAAFHKMAPSPVIAPGLGAERLIAGARHFLAHKAEVDRRADRPQWMVRTDTPVEIDLITEQFLLNSL